MKRTEKAETVSVVSSAFMAAAMIIVARLSGSVGILAEGIDTVVDVVASLAVVVGIRLSERHTGNFPGGLYKLENFVAVSIGVLIVISAYELARESIGRMLGESRTVEEPLLVIGVMAAVTIITGGLAWYKDKVGREENSPSLRADARHSWTDVLASAAVAGGVGLQMAGVPHMDSIAALIVVAALFWSGVQVTLEGVKVLLDVSIGKEILDLIQQCAENSPGIRAVTGVEGRNSGSYRFVKLSVVPYSRDLKEAEKSAVNLKKTIHSQIEHVDRIDVEFSDRPDDTAILAVPLTGDGTSPSKEFGNAQFLWFLEVSQPEGKIIREKTLQNPFAQKAQGRDIGTAVFLAKQGVSSLVAAPEFLSQAAACVLEANGVGFVDLPETIAGIMEARKYLVDRISVRSS